MDETMPIKDYTFMIQVIINFEQSFIGFDEYNYFEPFCKNR